MIPLIVFNIEGEIIMPSLKEYRNNELKWFLVANVLLMLLSAKYFTLENNASFLQLVVNVTNVAVFSATVYVFTFIVDSIIPSNIKTHLIFLWKRKPSETIFTRIKENCKDDRFTKDEALKRYANIYDRISKNNYLKKHQTSLWYEIYNRYRDNSMVRSSNMDYLLLRDLHSQLIVMLVAYLIITLLIKLFPFSWWYLFYLLAMLIILRIGAKIQGSRMVYTVIALDINDSKNNNEEQKG